MLSLEVNLTFRSHFPSLYLEKAHICYALFLFVSLLLWLQLQCLICNLRPIMIQSALMKAIESRIIVVTCCLVMLYRPQLPSWGLNSTTFTHGYWVPFVPCCSKSNDVADPSYDSSAFQIQKQSTMTLSSMFVFAVIWFRAKEYECGERPLLTPQAELQHPASQF